MWIIAVIEKHKEQEKPSNTTRRRYTKTHIQPDIRDKELSLSANNKERLLDNKEKGRDLQRTRTIEFNSEKQLESIAVDVIGLLKQTYGGDSETNETRCE